MMNKNNSLVFASFRYSGLVILDISNISNPTLLDSYPSNGGEQTVLSDNEKIAYLSDGL
jgi:hypothetical protein